MPYLGRWMLIHDEEWDADLLLPHNDPKYYIKEDAYCREVVLKENTSPIGVPNPPGYLMLKIEQTLASTKIYKYI